MPIPPPRAARPTAIALSVVIVLVVFCFFRKPPQFAHGQTPKVLVVFLVSVITHQGQKDCAKQSKDQCLNKADE